MAQILIDMGADLNLKNKARMLHHDYLRPSYPRFILEWKQCTSHCLLQGTHTNSYFAR